MAKIPFVPHYGLASLIVDVVRLRPVRPQVGWGIMIGKAHINFGDMNGFRMHNEAMSRILSPGQYAEYERGLGSRTVHFGAQSEPDLPFGR